MNICSSPLEHMFVKTGLIVNKVDTYWVNPLFCYFLSFDIKRRDSCVRVSSSS